MTRPNGYSVEIAIGRGGQISFIRMPFTTLRSANAAVRALIPKIGIKFANDPDTLSHTIKHAGGTFVVNTADVMCASVLDHAAFDACGWVFAPQGEKEAP